MAAPAPTASTPTTQVPSSYRWTSDRAPLRGEFLYDEDEEKSVLCVMYLLSGFCYAAAAGGGNSEANSQWRNHRRPRGCFIVKYMQLEGKFRPEPPFTAPFTTPALEGACGGARVHTSCLACKNPFCCGFALLQVAFATLRQLVVVIAKLIRCASH